MRKSEDDQEGYALAEKAVALCSGRGVIYANATYRRSSELGMFFKNGSLSVISPDSDAGISVRVVTDRGVGFASTNHLGAGGVRTAVSHALSMARAGSGNSADFAAGKAEVAEWTSPQKIKFGDVDTEEKVRRISELDSAMSDASRLKSFRQVGYGETVEHKFYADTDGARITALDPKVEISYFIMLQKGGDYEQAHRQLGYSGGFEAIDELKAESRAVEEVMAVETMLEKGRRFVPGTYDLVCGNEVTGIACHESCGHPMEADRIMGREAAQAGKSFVELDSGGMRIGSELVTIVDDPTIERSFGFYLYDDEGVKARRRTLYRRGVVDEFLQNRESGSKSGSISNGAGRAASYDSEPLVRMANTYLLPGGHSDQELVEGVKRGVLLKSFNEWNIDDRRFNQKYVGREAYLIENGEITVPVRSPVLEITTPGFWSAVDAVAKRIEYSGGTCGKGDPMQGMEVDMGGPMIRLRGIRMKG